MPTQSQNPETIVLHAGYRSDPATNAVAVPIYQTTSYQLRFDRARRQPVRAQGVRQHLHPHHEPDQARAGGAGRRARRRRRGAGARLGPGGVDVLRSTTSLRPATISSARPTSTAAPGTCS